MRVFGDISDVAVLYVATLGNKDFWSGMGRIPETGKLLYYPMISQVV